MGLAKLSKGSVRCGLLAFESSVIESTCKVHLTHGQTHKSVVFTVLVVVRAMHADMQATTEEQMVVWEALPSNC
jgi:hypothetical protein